MPARRIGVLCATLLLALVNMVGSGTGFAAAAPRYPTPDPDPFYAAPADLSALPPGSVTKSRPMPPLPLFPGVTVRLVQFRSTNSQGQPIAATSTLLTPSNWRPGGPLLSYQHIINGLGTRCAVSRVLYTADPNLVVREAPALNVVLQRGWSVALPDHLGPTAAYGAAKMGGQITLDGIRAVQQLPDAGLAASPVALAGYSGGGMATGWAAALAPEYAPELRLVGVAEGGVPMNLAVMAEAIGQAPHPLFGLAFAVALGLEREYPDQLPITEQLNDAGLALRDALTDGCTNEILGFGAGRSAADVSRSQNLATDPRARSVLDENSLELYPGVPTAPVFEWHSPIDGLIPIASIDATVRRYCAAGALVQTALIPTPDHLTTAVLGVPLALDYLDARFRGEPAPTTC